MGKTSTSWQPGRSGNPKGKPASASGRAALRAALSRPIKARSTETTLDRWAAEIVAAAVTLEDRLAVLKFLEGSAPAIPSSETLALSHEDALMELDSAAFGDAKARLLRGIPLNPAEIVVRFVDAPPGSLSGRTADDEDDDQR